MANAKRKCKQCKQFIPAGQGVKINTGFFCNIESAMIYAREKASKKKIADKAKSDRAERVELKKRKESIKPLGKWLSELQALVNRYVRIRDQYEGCISCEKPASWSGQWHASHYYSRGHSSGLRFNLWNIHKSCSVCNSHLSGNIGQYTPRIIEKIGQDKYDWLMAHKSDVCRYDVEYIKRAIKVARKAIKRIERRGSVSAHYAKLGNDLQKTLN